MQNHHLTPLLFRWLAQSALRSVWPDNPNSTEQKMYVEISKLILKSIVF